MDDSAVRTYLHNELMATFPDITLIVHQPPGDMILSRPCIVYEPTQHEPAFASNGPYLVGIRYTVTLLSDLPGYPTPRDIYKIKGISVNSSRMHVTQDIVHNVFTVSVNTI